MKVGVIGSSVAGCLAANKLAQYGYDVLLFDKKEFPRKKPCGGGLTNKTLKLLKSQGINLPASEQYPYIEYIHSFSIVCPGSVNGPFENISGNKSEDTLALVNRYDFDDWLRQQLQSRYITLIQDKINVASDHKSSITLFGDKSNYEVDYFIAADGVGSLFGKLAHGAYPANEVIQACEAIVPNHRGQFADVIQNPTHDPLNGGYSWIFAKEKTANIGTGVVRSYDKYYGYYKDWMKKIAVNYYNYNPFNDYTENWIIPLFKIGRGMYPGTFKAVVIGDALGCADVFFAEGIYGGMLNGLEAAEWLSKNDTFKGFQAYWYSHPYAKTMSALQFLQQQANGDYQRAHNLLKQPGVLEGFLKFISGEKTPQWFVRWVNMHYPIKSISLYGAALMNKGKEKEHLLAEHKEL
jgi:flavin-dependent dehydrogenase